MQQNKVGVPRPDIKLLKSSLINEEWVRGFPAGVWQGATKEHGRSAL